MKKIAQLIEVEDEGYLALIGKRVTLFCMNYIYTGDLAGVNATCVLLENPSIVYETGDFTTKTWKEAQKLPNSIYINTAAVEAFGEIK